jgi:hypothetical protein
VETYKKSGVSSRNNNINIKSIYFVLGIVTIIFGIYGSYFLSATLNNDQILSTGIYATYARDTQLFGYKAFIAYKDYPYEYPLISGLTITAISYISNLFYSPAFAAYIIVPLTMSLFSIISLILYYKMHVDWKLVALFWVFSLPVLSYGYGFEVEEMALFLAGYYFFTKKRYSISAILFGFSTATKYLPAVTLPIFVQNTTKKLRFSLIWIFTFVGSILTEYLMGPINFFRQATFLTGSGNGVQTSWYGLLAGKIATSTIKSIIGTSTAFRLSGYQIISAVLTALACSLIWFLTKKWKMPERIFAVFALTLVFFWMTSPNFIIIVAAILPLLSVRIKYLYITYLPMTILSFFPVQMFVIRYSFVLAEFWFTVFIQIFLVMMTLVVSLALEYDANKTYI